MASNVRKWLEVNTNNTESVGKYTLQSIISKNGCEEILEYEVLINNPPSIDLANTYTAYENIQTKFNWGSPINLILDMDEHEIKEISVFVDLDR